ncbi:MAG: hypothetical protein BWY85_02150 [Firmicutes bacterium ADurb.Bin506]|nr:MAG: hypothetical protein BWY85_02150 [Firmicutes bacterium ADurb.Bin506]
MNFSVMSMSVSMSASSPSLLARAECVEPEVPAWPVEVPAFICREAWACA